MKWKHCEPIIQCLQNSVESRFNTYFNVKSPESKKAIIAALSHPIGKSKWLACVPSEKHEQLISVLKERILSTMKTKVSSTIVTDSNNESAQLNTFFDFCPYSTLTDQHLQTNDNVELLLLQYFTDNRNDYTSLNAYPIIKNIFLKYNTPMPNTLLLQ